MSASAAAMEGLEAGWERFRSDIRGLREIANISQQKPLLQFHIPIRARQPKYRSGSGPAPPRINLRPVHDSSAFIVDKVVLPRGPFHPHDNFRQRRCYYIIGWPDLPAARPVVDASKILDYVSPRTLEDWEYEDALRREEDREKEKERQKEAEERAAVKGKAVATAVDGGLPGARRRPGRPRRAMMAVREPTPEPELNSEQEEMIHKRMRGPSLSTPQKSRLAQLVAEEKALEELEGSDENAQSAIHRQVGLSSEGEGDGDVNMVSLRLSSAVPAKSSGASSRASSARPVPANPPSSLAKAAAGVTARRTAAPALRRRADERDSSSPSRFSQAPARPQISTTPIPLPLHYSEAMKKHMPKSHAPSAVPTTNSPRYGGSNSIQADHLSSQSSFPADPPPSHTNGFTPIGGTVPRPPKRSAEDSPASADTPAKTKSKKSKKKRAELTAVEVEVLAEPTGSPDPALDLVQGEQDYVVKRLEGDYVLDGVHWFKVRWEGDWPADENPTWEPRENIAEKLVKQYLKRKAKRGTNQLARTSSKTKAKTKQQTSLADWAKKYGSVAEAFEGQAELNASDSTILLQGDGRHEALEDHDGPDELLVIDEEDETAAAERRKAMEAQIMAEFANMARAPPQHF